MSALGKVIGFLPTTDFARAKDFFVTKLELNFVSEDQFALVLESNGTMIRIANVVDFQPAAYTVLGWEVDDLRAVVTKLAQRGVAFEKYPFIQDKQMGIWDSPSGAKVAWFKVPDANVLSLTQPA